MTRSVVTGAAGFVGSHLTERLLAAGHEVIGVDCFTDYYARAAKEENVAAARADGSFRLIEDDICALDIERLLDGADVVFHLAGQAGVRPSWGASFGEYVRHNISATQRLLEVAKEAHLRRFIFASSSSVYGNARDLPVTEGTLPAPVSPYGVTKLAAEHLVSLYGQLFDLPVVSLRLFTVYGPRQRPDMAIHRFLRAARDDEALTVYGDGEQTRDFTFVDDVVSALVQAMDAPPGDCVYNVCGGSRISLNDLLELVGKLTERELRIEHADAARGDARHTLGDNARARQALGFAPKVSLADGVAAEWAWVREHEPR
jgi:nucleoside-diphosphate-sugar epimerase